MFRSGDTSLQNGMAQDGIQVLPRNAIKRRPSDRKLFHRRDMIWRRSYLHLGHFCKYAHRLAGNFRCLHIKFPDGSSVAARDGLYQARRACLELFSTISGICTTVSHSINACIVYNILLKFKINVEFFSEILKFSHHCNKESGENIDIRFSSRVKKWVSSQRLSCQLLKH